MLCAFTLRRMAKAARELGDADWGLELLSIAKKHAQEDTGLAGVYDQIGALLTVASGEREAGKVKGSGGEEFECSPIVAHEKGLSMYVLQISHMNNVLGLKFGVVGIFQPAAEAFLVSCELFAARVSRGRKK